MELDEALDTLAVTFPRKAQVIELRFFGGLSVAETAAVLDVSEDTVMRDWKLARVWLLSRDEEESRACRIANGSGGWTRSTAPR